MVGKFYAQHGRVRSGSACARNAAPGATSLYKETKLPSDSSFCRDQLVREYVPTNCLNVYKVYILNYVLLLL